MSRDSEAQKMRDYRGLSAAMAVHSFGLSQLNLGDASGASEPFHWHPRLVAPGSQVHEGMPSFSLDTDSGTPCNGIFPFSHSLDYDMGNQPLLLRPQYPHLHQQQPLQKDIHAAAQLRDANLLPTLLPPMSTDKLLILEQGYMIPTGQPLMLSQLLEQQKYMPQMQNMQPQLQALMQFLEPQSLGSAGQMVLMQQQLQPGQTLQTCVEPGKQLHHVEQLPVHELQQSMNTSMFVHPSMLQKGPPLPILHMSRSNDQQQQRLHHQRHPLQHKQQQQQQQQQRQQQQQSILQNFRQQQMLVDMQAAVDELHEKRQDQDQVQIGAGLHDMHGHWIATSLMIDSGQETGAAVLRPNQVLSSGLDRSHTVPPPTYAGDFSPYLSFPSLHFKVGEEMQVPQIRSRDVDGSSYNRGSLPSGFESGYRLPNDNRGAFIPNEAVPKAGGNANSVDPEGSRCLSDSHSSLKSHPSLNSLHGHTSLNRATEPAEQKGQQHPRFMVDPGRIQSGKDQRTTLMIKNIPNNYTQEMLVKVVDESFSDSYTFLYLPIDPKNKCNVGYAFINMRNPGLIIPFVQRFQNMKWERRRSLKMADITYARIQGQAPSSAHKK